MLLNNVNIPSNLFLGPMAGVTDFAFRKICREFGLEMSYTEMVSSKGIYYKDKKTFQLLKIDQGEHPIGVQIFGSDPYFMSESVLRIQNEIDYEILDINMGCPTPKIVKNGDGSALLNYPQKAFDIVKAVVAVSEKPVTVKIRIGWDKVGEIVQFAKLIEEAGAVAITVHGRTRDQFYSGTADWDTIKLIKDALKIPVIGNGDIFTLQDAIDKQRESGVDGIMIARGAQGNPWLIKNIVHYNKTGKKLPDPSLEEVISVLFKHLAYSIESKGEHRGLIEMRKHVGWYIKGYKHASIVRNKINQATSVDEFRYCVNELLDNNK